MRDPDVWTLREAANKLGVSYSRACVMARDGDFPGIIPLRKSGKQRKWLVSVPRFNLEVHGSPPEIKTSLRTGEDQAGTRRVSGLSTSGGHTDALSVSPTQQGQPAPTAPVPAPLLRRDWGLNLSYQGKGWEPCVVTEPTEVSR